ncbi:MAG: hypothetical protein M3O09_18190 [Acidobacteriota bacterium]|nr:hypothetical protein [Acidobacteriota bacterium]
MKSKDHTYYMPHLLYALSAPTQSEQAKLLNRIVEKKIVSRATMYRRLHKLPHIRRFGANWLKDYETEMNALINAHEARRKVEKLLGEITPEELRERVKIRVKKEKDGQESISVEQAAKLLQVRYSTLRDWIDVLGRLKTNREGRLDVADVNKLEKSHLVAAYRARKRMGV